MLHFWLHFIMFFCIIQLIATCFSLVCDVSKLLVCGKAQDFLQKFIVGWEMLKSSIILIAAAVKTGSTRVGVMQ